MSTRDYKSYGILDKEISAEDNILKADQAKQQDTTVIQQEAKPSRKQNNEEKQSVSLQRSENDEQIKQIDETTIKKQLSADRIQKKNQESSREALIVNQNNVPGYVEDTSFIGYKKQNPLRKRSSFFKWISRIVETAIFIMLLPFTCIILAAIGTVIAVVAAGIIVCIGTGIVILGGICFMSSQLSASLVILGVMASIAAFSLAGIIIILTTMFIKWFVGQVRKRKQKKMNQNKGGQ